MARKYRTYGLARTVVCFDCRTVSRQVVESSGCSRRCPGCQKTMVHADYPPPKEDVKAWEKYREKYYRRLRGWQWKHFHLARQTGMYLLEQIRKKFGK